MLILRDWVWNSGRGGQTRQHNCTALVTTQVEVGRMPALLPLRRPLVKMVAMMVVVAAWEQMVMGKQQQQTSLGHALAIGTDGLLAVGTRCGFENTKK